MEYDKYTQPFMDELNKRFKFFTKQKEHTWLIQSNKNSLCEAFFVHTTCNGYIIMTGDYNGIMLHPYGNSQEQLPNWMAGATSITYFAEKVINADYHHKVKEWTSEQAHYDIEERFIEYYNEEGNGEEEQLVEYASKYYKTGTLHHIQKRAKDFLDNMGFDYEKGDIGMGDMLDQLNRFDDGDWWEKNLGVDYLDQFKWQHKCLVFWANKILEGAFEEVQKPEVNKIQEVSADSSHD